LFGKPGGTSALFNKISKVEGLVRDDLLNKVAEQVFRVMQL
jgi:hypothetical protein